MAEPNDGRPAFADPGDVRELALALSRAALACRDLGHNWRSQTVSVTDSGYEQSLRCTRCKTVRTRRLDRRGGIGGNRYDYPDGYLFDQPVGRMAGDARSALRLVALERELERSDG